MPPVSKAQRRWAHGACKDKRKPAKERKAACEYAASDRGGPIPEHKRKKGRRPKR